MRLHQRKTVAAVGLSSILAIAGSVPVAAFVVGFPDALWRFSIRATAGKHLGMEDVALQDKPNNCGPAVIKMLFDHYKIPSTLAEIEKRVGLTEKGTSMLSLKETAESVGLRAQGWRYSLENLQRAPMPVIVFVHKDHFALVDSVTTDRRVVLRDPALGKMEMAKEQFLKVWNGETLVFERQEESGSR